MFRWLTSVVIVVGLALAVVGCASSTSPSATVSSISVTGSTPAVGATSQFTVTAKMSDGTTQDVTSLATWQSSNTAVATVASGTRVVTGVAPSVSTITNSASCKRITGPEFML